MPDYSDIVEKHFKRVGLDPAWGKKIMQIESGGDPGNTTGSYQGLFQLSKEEFRKGGGTGDRKDPEQNAMAAANVLSQHARDFKDRTGKDANLIDLYMIHQQGAAGYAAHANNPDAPAWQNMQEASGKSAAWAKKAIWGNLSDSAKEKYGSVENVASKDFVGEWSGKIAGTTYQPGGITPGVKGTRPETEEAEAKPDTSGDLAKLADLFLDVKKSSIPPYQVPQIAASFSIPRPKE